MHGPMNVKWVERQSGNAPPPQKKRGKMKGGRKELKRESKKDSGWLDTWRPAGCLGRLTNIKESMGRASRQIMETCKHVSLIRCWRPLPNYYVILNILVISPYNISLLCFQIQTLQYMHLTLRRLMSYIYGAPILDVSRSHTTTQHSR